eukprot:5056617-Amphidinium_carterae.1
MTSSTSTSMTLFTGGSTVLSHAHQPGSTPMTSSTSTSMTLFTSGITVLINLRNYADGFYLNDVIHINIDDLVH